MEQDEQRAEREGAIPKRQSLARTPPEIRGYDTEKKVASLKDIGLKDIMHNKRTAEESPEKTQTKKKKVDKNEEKGDIIRIIKCIEAACETIEVAISRVSGNKMQFHKEQQMATKGALETIRIETLRLHYVKKMKTEETKRESMDGLEKRMNVEIEGVKKEMNDMKGMIMKCMQGLFEINREKKDGETRGKNDSERGTENAKATRK